MAIAASRRPAEQDYAPCYARYVSLVPDGDVLRLLELQGAETQKLLRSVSEEKSQFRCAAGKWSIREVVGHIADTERLFAFRARTWITTGHERHHISVLKERYLSR